MFATDEDEVHRRMMDQVLWTLYGVSLAALGARYWKRRRRRERIEQARRASAPGSPLDHLVRAAARQCVAVGAEAARLLAGLDLITGGDAIAFEAFKLASGGDVQALGIIAKGTLPRG